MSAGTNSKLRRILLAVTDADSIGRLWHVVASNLGEARVELLTVFVSDERWHRVASLPFSREVSGVSGRSMDFTAKRADQVNHETIEQARSKLRKLAEDAGMELIFEVLPEAEATRLREITGAKYDLLIAPANIKDRPVYAEIVRLECRLLLVD